MDQRKKPPRLANVFSAYLPPLYFVTMVTWNRHKLLASPLVHETFVERAEKQCLRNISVGRYVIMPDHIHCFLRIGEDESLGVTVSHLKQSVTKVLRKNEPELRVWQPGFFDHLLRRNESYTDKWEYVRMNPVRAGLVKDADTWPYHGEIVSIDRV